MWTAILTALLKVMLMMTMMSLQIFADACTLFSHLQRQDMLPLCSLQAIVVACCCIVNGIVSLFLYRFVSSANQSECHCHPKYCHGDKYSGLVRDGGPSLGTSMKSARKTMHAFREKQQAFPGILQRQQTEHRTKSNAHQGQALRINASTNKEQSTSTHGRLTESLENKATPLINQGESVRKSSDTAESKQDPGKICETKQRTSISRSFDFQVLQRVI